MAVDKQIYYVRIAFDGGDGRGRPLPGPAQEVDDFDCYKPFLHLTPQDALKSAIDWSCVGGFSVQDRLFTTLTGIVPPHEEPLRNPYDEYICSCSIDDNGELDMGRRLYFISRDDREIHPLSFDEDFLITMEREYIFSVWDMEDPHAPAMRY